METSGIVSGALSAPCENSLYPEGTIDGQEPRHHQHDAGRDLRRRQEPELKAPDQSREARRITAAGAAKLGGEGRDRRGAHRRPGRPAAGRLPQEAQGETQDREASGQGEKRRSSASRPPKPQAGEKGPCGGRRSKRVEDAGYFLS